MEALYDFFAKPKDPSRFMAVQLGLDRSTFKDCIAKRALPRAIVKDLKASRTLNVKGTPTFFIEGQSFSGGIPERVLESAIKRGQHKKKRAESVQ